ncbi:hypothetical protein U1Q18_025176, partial [Sarracenia purpurea var. burkii]
KPTISPYPSLHVPSTSSSSQDISSPTSPSLAIVSPSHTQPLSSSSQSTTSSTQSPVA